MHTWHACIEAMMMAPDASMAATSAAMLGKCSKSTNSGRPCMRKATVGSVCWQHARTKLGPVKSTSYPPGASTQQAQRAPDLRARPPTATVEECRVPRELETYIVNCVTGSSPKPTPRCGGSTQQGGPCQIATRHDSGRCWRHRGQHGAAREENSEANVTNTNVESPPLCSQSAAGGGGRRKRRSEERWTGPGSWRRRSRRSGSRRERSGERSRSGGSK